MGRKELVRGLTGNIGRKANGVLGTQDQSDPEHFLPPGCRQWKAESVMQAEGQGQLRGYDAVGGEQSQPGLQGSLIPALGNQVT